MNNYWLIPMDFKTCNYEQMEEEWNQNKKIMWQVSGTPKLKNDEWIVQDGMAKSLKKGDIVYFYVINLPSESKDALSRIMLRGIIVDEPYPIEKRKVYLKSQDSTMIIGFSIGSLSTFSKEQLENNLFLSYEDLRKKDINFKHPQGKNWPDKIIKRSLSTENIDILENCFKKNIQTNDFKMLINYFKKKCFFCDKYGVKNDHKTFMSRNGLDYYEYHHFIPQHKWKKFPELKAIIDDPANGLFLCSNCHNKIHYGRSEEVNQMLKIILADKKIKEMFHGFNFQSNIGENKNIFDWFQETYDSKLE